jgi:hypothetical protein
LARRIHNLIAGIAIQQIMKFDAVIVEHSGLDKDSFGIRFDVFDAKASDHIEH